MKEVWFFFEEYSDSISSYDFSKIGDFDSFEEAWEEREKHLEWKRKVLTPIMKGYVKEK